MLQKSLIDIAVEIINKDRIKLNFEKALILECLKNNPDCYKIKRDMIDLGKKLKEIALEYMDKYIK